ncbi:hypothetical protein QQS21_004233 [Conoideocrella luteorostrata]|uniref:Extracellular matrix protein n=1 Tax=Conoideocrella luteorostrata TaxID=1105319 RepID=A0AAJ0G1Q0_9HYPO|nr:hypothetical protein QQS21_004233 [Conoideocrella luteorostrata]
MERVTRPPGQPTPPKLLNPKYTVAEGQTFTFKFSGCEGVCTIAIRNKDNPKDVKIITSDASGSSLDWTPKELGSDTYNIRITNNASNQNKYAGPFDYKGIGPPGPSTSGASTTRPSTKSSIKTTLAPSSAKTDSTVTSAVTSSAGSASATSAPTTTAGDSNDTSKSTSTSSTTIPNAGVRASPLALVAGAGAAFAFLG